MSVSKKKLMKCTCKQLYIKVPMKSKHADGSTKYKRVMKYEYNKGCPLHGSAAHKTAGGSDRKAVELVLKYMKDHAESADHFERDEHGNLVLKPGMKGD